MKLLLPAILVQLHVTSPEWIQIQHESVGHIEREIEGLGGCWKTGCAPDIHSWTSATWSQNSSKEEDEPPTTGLPRTAEGNVLLLTSLHRNLEEQIESRVMDLGNREARTLGKGMGSMESALITISLLTFAVYVIKLIMMLINSLHHKKKESSHETHTMLDPETGAQSIVFHHGRKRRSDRAEDYRDLINFLELFEYSDN